MTPVAPGKVQAIAIMQLVVGILAVLVAIVVAFATVFIYLPWIYSLVVGIMAIIRGSALLGTGSYGAGNSKAVPIMLIVNIINCDTISLVVGIICLVFQSDPKVVSYLEGESNIDL